MPLLLIRWTNVVFAIKLGPRSLIDNWKCFHNRSGMELDSLIVDTVGAWKVRLMKYEGASFINQQDFVLNLEDLLNWSWDPWLDDQLLLLHNIDLLRRIRKRAIDITSIFNNRELFQRELALVRCQDMHWVLPWDRVWAPCEVNQLLTVSNLNICLTNFLEYLKSWIKLALG